MPALAAEGESSPASGTPFLREYCGRPDVLAAWDKHGNKKL